MFKKLKTQVVGFFESKPVAVATRNIDAEIHRDVFSAQELLLAEARRVLETEYKYDEADADRLAGLAALGFRNAEEVRRFNEIDKRRKANEEMMERINYYSQIYPSHKFIDQKTARAICDKYDLYLAFVSDYVSDIPEKNQKEIVDFRIRRKDIREADEIQRGGGGWMMPFLVYDCLLDDYYASLDKEELLKGENLLIIAPLKKLDIRGREVKDRILMEIKDPVVLQPVPLGYLIVTSWGLEASDPEIQNPRHN